MSHLSSVTITVTNDPFYLLFWETATFFSRRRKEKQKQTKEISWYRLFSPSNWSNVYLKKTVYIHQFVFDAIGKWKEDVIYKETNMFNWYVSHPSFFIIVCPVQDWIGHLEMISLSAWALTKEILSYLQQSLGLKVVKKFLWILFKVFVSKNRKREIQKWEV